MHGPAQHVGVAAVSFACSFVLTFVHGQHEGHGGDSNMLHIILRIVGVAAVLSLWFALCIWRVARHPPHVARARARQPSEAGDGYEVSVSSHWLAHLMAISEYRVHH